MAPKTCANCKATLADSEGRLCLLCYRAEQKMSVDAMLRKAGFVVAWRPRSGQARWWRHRLYGKEYDQEEAVRIAIKEGARR